MSKLTDQKKHTNKQSKRPVPKTFWTEKITIGNMHVPRFMSAPLDGITDSPFRRMIRKFSQEELLFTEMRHAAHVAREKKERTLRHEQCERPLCFQISANTLEFVEPAIERIIRTGFDMINLNCGCPSRNVIKSGSGSALMGDPEHLKNLLSHIMNVIDNRVPMTIKIRAGFKTKNALEISQMAEDLGVTCIIIHPRTQPEMSQAPLDFDLVKKLKQIVKVPVIFSGEIKCFADAVHTYEQTGVDGFMIGRALWGVPWKLHELKQESLGKTFELDTKQITEYLIEHFELHQKFYGEKSFQSFKKQLPLYIRGIHDASNWRKKLVLSKTAQEMSEQLYLLKKDLAQEKKDLA